MSSDPLERVIRPIVEGQLRGFVKEHPGVLNGVTWYKGSKHGQAATFVNSVAKRIVRDLLCPESRARIEQAFFEVWESEKSAVEVCAAAKAGTPFGLTSQLPVQLGRAGNTGPAGTVAGRSAFLLPQIQWAAS